MPTIRSCVRTDQSYSHMARASPNIISWSVKLRSTSISPNFVTNLTSLSYCPPQPYVDDSQGGSVPTKSPPRSAKADRHLLDKSLALAIISTSAMGTVPSVSHGSQKPTFVTRSRQPGLSPPSRR